MEKKPTLWTKNFTILSLGTVVSTLGNAVSGFAICLLVLDYTGSTLLYAVFNVVYNLPKVIMPFLAGPYLDRFSRAKAIYTLDFISAALYLVIFVVLKLDIFNYATMLILCLIIGSVDSIYQVAYDSLYPMLITPGFSTKALQMEAAKTLLPRPTLPSKISPRADLPFTMARTKSEAAFTAFLAAVRAPIFFSCPFTISFIWEG